MCPSFHLCVSTFYYLSQMPHVIQTLHACMCLENNYQIQFSSRNEAQTCFIVHNNLCLLNGSQGTVTRNIFQLQLLLEIVAHNTTYLLVKTGEKC